MIGQGCDVVFGVGGNTGNGGLLAAKEKGLMAIGVDVDQYLTYPEVKDALSPAPPRTWMWRSTSI